MYCAQVDSSGETGTIKAMPFPKLTDAEVMAAVPEATDVNYLDKGAQKVVYSATIAGQRYALKFMRPSPRPLADQDEDASVQPVSLDDVTARARREVATMKQCDSPHLVKIGPIELRSVKVGNEDLIYFSEELIDGEPIKKLLKPNKPGLSPEELVQLGLHVADAIDALWKHRKIHRDIKPGNVMRRRTGEFVVLDMGLVFDLNDESWSVVPVGTHIYFSPEQMDFTNRRQVLDFRSDLFSLGITMYQLGTGVHPFVSGAQNSWDVLNQIKNQQPAAPRTLNGTLPEPLSEIIMRLLAKRPALRYRKLSMLRDALRSSLAGGGN
jgi:serine/threonine-protein kinase